ncbi:hypothetical protein EMO90_03535 [Bifidobacterium vespertilionis]|uniref:Uncharacterized protein n=2 Tax=Bifidobacterium vespertilionis TaxID=2562524 RepID=A0A5J5E6Y6_9BIFI|nr:hypothetical protein EMO90_03535 [Bifidobacterium vespertilionis]KAA8824786.1 hypothetical protein EM848_00830 [Bifidobacterium vespertilionis]
MATHPVETTETVRINDDEVDLSTQDQFTSPILTEGCIQSLSLDSVSFRWNSSQRQRIHVSPPVFLYVTSQPYVTIKSDAIDPTATTGLGEMSKSKSPLPFE